MSRDPLIAVAVVGVMQLVALVFVFAWYAIRDRYGHDCDHGDHKLIATGAQSPTDMTAPLTGKRTTIILSRCRYCTHVQTVTVDGTWSLEQVRAWGSGIIPGTDWQPGDDDTAPVPVLDTP